MIRLIGVWRHVNTGRSICANCGRVKPTQAVKDGQQDTMHNSSYVTQLHGNTDMTLVAHGEIHHISSRSLINVDLARAASTSAWSVLLVVNWVTLCNVWRIMHCVSLAILSRLSRFHPPTVGTNWPILCWRAVKHQTNMHYQSPGVNGVKLAILVFIALQSLWRVDP